MNAQRRLARTVALGLLLLLLATGCQYRFGIVGDSVTYDARHQLEERGARVRAYGGIDIPAGRPALRELRRDGFRVVVSALGGMDLARGASFPTIRRRIRNATGDVAGVDCVIWLDLNQNPNIHPNWPEDATRFNQILRQVAGNHGIQVAPWSRLAAQHPGAWFRSDGIHLRPNGRRGYAAFISRYVRDHC